MNFPNFQPISTKNPLDNSLKAFFLDTLGYHHIDKDPDDTDPDRPEAWRMVVPIEGSRPFAVAYKRGLSTMRRREVSRLYIDRVIPHCDDSPTILLCRSYTASPTGHGLSSLARTRPATGTTGSTFPRTAGDFGLCRRSSRDSTGIDLSSRPVSGRSGRWLSFYSRAHLFRLTSGSSATLSGSALVSWMLSCTMSRH